MAYKYLYATVIFVIFSLTLADVTRTVRRVRSINPFVTNVKCDPGERFGCADCSTVQVCHWDGTVIESSKYRCDSVNPSQPYCNGNSGTCSATPTGDCDQPSDLCPAEGIFPQPTNCREFIYCDADKNAYITPCASNEAYNHTVQDCVRSGTCFQINCAAATSQDQWYTYTPASELYVFCSSTAGTMTFECPKNEIFNPKLKRCDFSCPGAGRFAIPNEPANSKRYYQCVLGTGNVFTYTIQQCAGILVFDTVNLRCAPP
ncbi:uncharacterized protein LOC131692427 [Topomyia yanbarensis]|uniref:uncharacterized protein LOC131692427 n=1 Tax=Topomyia yanbarensis TaxID=2498891 RepID=UPI00273C26F7|nr:uncharacterized protein LOC131692427 [Topomyia yanbarensis]